MVDLVQNRNFGRIVGDGGESYGSEFQLKKPQPSNFSYVEASRQSEEVIR
jgi:hypothetical protein